MTAAMANAFRRKAAVILAVLLCVFPPVARADDGEAQKDSRLGSDAALPFIKEEIEKLPLTAGEMYECDETDVRALVDTAAEIHINVFEIIDCCYRLIEPMNARIAIRGDHLRGLQDEYNLGSERVLAILALEKLDRIEFGAKLDQSQEALDLHLNEPYETYIEIGTAIYDRRAGFKTISPKLFDDAFGITVKKLFIKSPLVKLELFAPGKGAIYVKAISRPKRWNLDVVTYK